MFRISLLLIVSLHGCYSKDVPSVVTNLGKIIGHYLTSFEGNKYEAYQGIPYAFPPTGERRFKSPEPIQPWSKELVANRLRDTCWQYQRVTFPSGKFVQGTEDCLYLNIYIPARSDNSPLPVVLYIHGGGFVFGGNNEEDEHYLADYQVIFVTIQYRLGVLGFLSTEDDVVSGNMGLKDQSLAIKWVHDNIDQFGGDSKRITIFGDSAGAASVHYHYLSPMSAGLFRNGYSFSGTAFNCWAQIKNSREKAFELGSIMNCPTNDSRTMVDCLRTRSADDLTEALAKFMFWRQNPGVPFGPVVEKFAKDPFIDRSPMEIISSGRAYDAPWLVGSVSEEGLYPVAEYAKDGILKDMNENWDDLAPYLLEYHYTIAKSNQTNVSRAIRKHYFGEKPIDRTTFMNLVYLVGDRWFTVDAEKAALAQAKANVNPVWFYHYTYRATDSLSSELSNSTEKFGVCHGDDLYLFIKNDYLIPTKSSRDMAMHRDIIQLLTSYASDGKPDINVKWNKVDSTKTLQFLHIAGPGDFTMKMVDNLAEEEFWNSIEFEENRSDYVPNVAHKSTVWIMFHIFFAVVVPQFFI